MRLQRGFLGRHKTSAGIAGASLLLIVGTSAAALASNDTPAPTHDVVTVGATPSTTNVEATNDSQSTPDDTATGTHSSSTNVTSTQAGDGSVSTQVTVNGQPVAVPANGTTQQTITSPNGQATVTVGSSNNSSYTSTNLNVFSSSYDNNYTSGGQ